MDYYISLSIHSQYIQVDISLFEIYVSHFYKLNKFDFIFHYSSNGILCDLTYGSNCDPYDG